MSDKISKIKISELPSSESIHDEDVFIESNSLETYKVTADDVAKYVSQNEHITEKYTQSDLIGESDGIAPLNSSQKVDGQYITYGTETNTAYEGSSGKMLEQRLEAEKSRAISAETAAYQQAAGYIDQKIADLKTVAFTGSYSDLSDQPSIPTKVSELANDSGYKTTDTNTWKANTASSEGYVASGSGQANKIWETDANGNPTWRTEIDTTYGVATTSENGLMNASDKAKLDGVSFNGTAAITHYGTCSTAAATAAKVVACTGFTLVTGATIRVKFTVTNTAVSPTLNVNSTGAKAIYYRGATITAGYLVANRTYELVYNGTQYELIGDNISSLETEMNSLKKSVSDGKSAVTSTITAQGVTTAADTAFSTMASNITTLSANRYQSGINAAKAGTAVAANVLTGKTFTNTSSVGVTGTMTNNGAVSKTFTPSTSDQSYTVPTGYHNGSGTVTCNAISTETKTFKPTTNSTSHSVTPACGNNAGVSAGGSGKYKVKTGSYAYTPSGSGWYRPAISTGLSTVSGFLLSARRSDGGDGGSGCLLTEYTASGGTVTAAVYLARLNYTISWIAYGT